MDFMDLLHFLFRWGHVVFGIAWIGLLYYFNFVQGGYMAAASDAAKVDAFTKLVPSALWWFRWAAMMTFLTGVVLLIYIMSALSAGILLGGLMATLMFLNVWLIIWPNQKVVIASNEALAGGGSADPNQAEAAGKALLASRTNTLLSLPMVFFMLSHAPPYTLGAGTYAAGFWIGLAIVLLIEGNAIFGKLGPIATVKGVIGSSVVLTAVMVALLAFL